MEYFLYGEKEINHLIKKDKKLGEAIVKIGLIKREVTPDVFTSLMGSIVSQQISTKAAKTVFERLKTISGGKITPKSINSLSQEDIKSCGMSFRKADYIKRAAASVFSKELDLESLSTMPDEQVIKQLSSLSGVGVWTAEMLMIFSLSRPDVLSFGDLGIRRGISILYHNKEITKEKFLQYKRRYSPYGSVASIYLWEIAHIGKAPEEGLDLLPSE